MLSPDPIIVLAALLLLAGVLLSKTSSRLGVPSLLLFLGLGMLAGSEGLLGIHFEDFVLAQRYGIVALTFILFSGGAGTAWQDIRRVLDPWLGAPTRLAQDPSERRWVASARPRRITPSRGAP